MSVQAPAVRIAPRMKMNAPWYGSRFCDMHFFVTVFIISGNTSRKKAFMIPPHPKIVMITAGLSSQMLWFIIINTPTM